MQTATCTTLICDKLAFVKTEHALEYEYKIGTTDRGYSNPAPHRYKTSLHRPVFAKYPLESTDRHVTLKRDFPLRASTEPESKQKFCIVWTVSLTPVPIPRHQPPKTAPGSNEELVTELVAVRFGRISQARVPEKVPGAFSGLPDGPAAPLRPEIGTASRCPPPGLAAAPWTGLGLPRAALPEHPAMQIHTQARLTRKRSTVLEALD